MSAKISVLLPAYNAEKTIGAALESLLTQTLPDFEILVFDDASTDGTCEIINSYQDERIKLYQKEKNTGYTASLNEGLKLAAGKYIARMDADDVCHPSRFERQVNFLENHPEIDVCGTWFEILGTEHVVRHPVSHDALVVAILEYTPIGHPTAMLRAEFFKQSGLSYNPDFEPAEDIDLWQRASEIGVLANLPETLLSYRMHAGQISEQKKIRQQTNAASVSFRQLSRLNVKFDPLFVAREISGTTTLSGQELLEILRQLGRLRKSNKKSGIFSAELFEGFLARRKRILLNFWLHSAKPDFFVRLITLLRPPFMVIRELTSGELKMILRA